MNKKDIAHFRNQFKPNNDLLKINELFSVYIMRESSEVYHAVNQPFELIEAEQQELYRTHVKKLLAGQPDQKLFELTLKQDTENPAQLVLHKGLLAKNSEDWTGFMLSIVEKMLAVRQYDKDTVVTFIRGEYTKPVKKTSEEREESDRDFVYANPFILCSISKTEEPKKELLFDYVEKEFKARFALDPIINLTAPLSGFLFPCFTGGTMNVNHVLYAAGKAYEPDYVFIEDVLNAEEPMTAQDDKAVFEEIVKDVTGGSLTASTLSNVYEEIHRIVEENEDDHTPTLDSKDVENVLKLSGVEGIDSNKIKAAYETIIDDTKYELKATSVLPKYTSKSIKIQTKAANIAVSPQDLRYVKQVMLDGRRYLMIEVEEEAVIEGFTVAPEEIGRLVREK